MERASGEILSGAAEGAVEPDRNLFGGPVGEGDGTDPLRQEAELGDQVLDPPDEAVGLSGPGAGHYQHGSQVGLDGLTLLVGWRIQLHEWNLAAESGRREALPERG